MMLYLKQSESTCIDAQTHKYCFLCLLQVIWKREDGNTVLTVGKVVFASDKDLTITHLPLRDEWNLIINNVKPKHAGRYECQISTAAVLRRFVRLNVIGMQLWFVFSPMYPSQYQ